MSVQILNKRFFGNERKYVDAVLDGEFRSSFGSAMAQRLETLFAKKFGAKCAISHINGTATLHSILEAMQIRPGDEVIVPPLTMAATTFAVLQANATPVFADVDPDTFQLDPASIRTRITKKTRAIITVALYGLSPDMDAILRIARAHNLFVIEDNAQAFLSRYKGRMVGTLGHASSFSFQSSKHISSGEGGIVLTDDLRLADKVRRVNSLGYAGVGAMKGRITKRDIQDPGYSRHVSMGWNYRMSELCAAVALAQTENIEALVGKRIAAAGVFDEAARPCSWLSPQKVGPDYENSYWSYVVRLDHPRVTWKMFRDKFVNLGGDGFYAAWKLTYLEPMFRGFQFMGRESFISKANLRRYKPGLCPIAEELQPKLIQFKTNYWDLNKAYRQAEILKKTIQALG